MFHSTEIELEDVDIREITAESGETAVHLYTIDLNLQCREFKGQTSGITKTTLKIGCDSVPEFKSILWIQIKDRLKREVVCEDDKFQWHDHILPQEEDLERFILFYDSKSKRSMTLDKVNLVTLNHWRSKEIWIYVHVYSMSIANLSLWKKVQKNLIEPINRDRAGATNIAEMNTLVGRLKQIHKFRYQSSHINWIMWANRIQASESHQREKMITSPPPPEMLHLFAIARTPADETVSDVRQNLSVAENVNGSVSSGLAKVRILVDDILKIQQAITNLRDEEKAKIEMLNHELKTMETTAVTTQSLISAMEQALPAHETDFGRQLLSHIEDQEDVDHIVHES